MFVVSQAKCHRQGLLLSLTQGTYRVVEVATELADDVSLDVDGVRNLRDGLLEWFGAADAATDQLSVPVDNRGPEDDGVL